MIPRQIQDQLSAYKAHQHKAKSHLAEANRQAKKLLIERGVELNAIDHEYMWDLFQEDICYASPIGVCVVDNLSKDLTCIFCGE